MRRIAIAAGSLLVVVAVVAVARPDGAGAVDPPASTDTLTVGGDGVVSAVPDRAEISAGVETRASTAKGALQANAAAMEDVLRALHAAGGSDVTTQAASLSSSLDQQGRPNGFVASNVASASVDFARAGASIDASVAAGATMVYGPSLSRSDADSLDRDALARAVDDAHARAVVLARAAGRELGRVVAVSESGGASGPVFAKAEAARDAATPIESGPQETTASVSVTYELR
jgi:uncharacterized protein YggE